MVAMFKQTHHKTMKNTITEEQLSLLWNKLDQYQEEHGLPDFWTICDAPDTRFVCVDVQDFDGKHDFDFVRRMLEEVGVQLDTESMLDSWALARIDREEEERPLQASSIEGDGELGRVYGYELIRA